MPFLSGLCIKDNTNRTKCKGETSLFFETDKNSMKDDCGNFCLVACQGFRRGKRRNLFEILRLEILIKPLDKSSRISLLNHNHKQRF